MCSSDPSESPGPSIIVQYPPTPQDAATLELCMRPGVGRRHCPSTVPSTTDRSHVSSSVSTFSFSWILSWVSLSAQAAWSDTRKPNDYIFLSHEDERWLRRPSPRIECAWRLEAASEYPPASYQTPSLPSTGPHCLSTTVVGCRWLQFVLCALLCPRAPLSSPFRLLCCSRP